MLKIACATNDGKHFIREHFGEADKYLVYRFDSEKNDFVFEKEIVNPHYEENGHGDPKKANFISSILKPEKINAVMNRAIGKNIVRMRRNFVVIVSRVENIEEALKRLDMKAVGREAQKPAGTDREIIYVKDESKGQ